MSSACSLRTIALRSLADAIAEPGDSFSREDDPELVRESLPLLLKIMEQLSDGLPTHVGIRTALARGFASYGVAFIEDDADRLTEVNVAQGKEKYDRAKKLLLRAHGYGLQALDLTVPGFRAGFASRDKAARAGWLARSKKTDVPLLYWTGAALAAAVSAGKDDMRLVGELPRAEELMTRALELDEAYDEGSLHEFFIAYDMARGAAGGGGPASARKHYERALALAQNKKLGPVVTYAESVLVDEQKKDEFVRLLEGVVKADVAGDRAHRLVNTLAQRRARWLLSRTGDLFAN